MNILVFGGRGVVGSAVVPLLRSRGHFVTTADRRHGDDHRHTRCDIRDKDRVAKLIARHYDDDHSEPEVILNLAAEFGRWNGENYYEDLWTTNVVGLANILHAIPATGARLVHISTSEVYGRLGDDGGALKESYVGPCSFHTLSNQYALSKATNEHQLAIAARDHQVASTVVRIFNAYGPGEAYTPFRSVVCQLTHDMLLGERTWVAKDATRDLLYIDDLAAALALVVEAGAGGEVYNIGGGQETSIWDLAMLIRDHVQQRTGREVRMPDLRRDGSTCSRKNPDTHRIRDLGWRPRVAVDEGVSRTVDWQAARYGTPPC